MFEDILPVKGILTTRIAVINEVSAADLNKDILTALEGRGHKIINTGMKSSAEKHELSYIHTGLLSALLLHLKRVDLVVGGCGTGQGFLNAVMQYPGVFCGHILNPLDAWLFAQINAGNCISLALNQGYGWAGDVNLRMIFDSYFSVERGGGYPPQRMEAQRVSRQMLEAVSRCSHRSMAEIIETLPEVVVRPVVSYPGVVDLLDVDTIADPRLRTVLLKYS